MKLAIATFFLSLSSASASASYTPIEDVVPHSNMARDVALINDLVGTDNDAALTIYTEGKSREGKTLQMMATKDWAGAGADDTIKKQYAAILGVDYLESFNIDAMTCSGSWEGKSDTMCTIATKKNLICTHLDYALYEGEKAIANASQKNWDELYAFWHGVYLEGDELFGKNTPHAVQGKRDGNYGTGFSDASFAALNNGKDALQEETVSTFKVRNAFNQFIQANAATFGGQATLKYAYETGMKTGDDQDKPWAEGYTYFRCAAGLLNADLANTINADFDPRTNESFPDGLFCKFVKEMISVGDIGQGISVKDLQILNFIPSAETDCGLTAGTLGSAGNSKTDDSADDDDAPKTVTDDSADDDDTKATTGDGDDSSAVVSRVGMTALGATLLSFFLL